VLCHTLLHQRLGPLHNLAKPSRLILAESLLEMDDLRGAYDALKELYGYRLSLGEAMRLLQVQLDYLARIGAWEQVLDQMPAKLELAELMPSNAAARVQAVMAMAARKLNRGEWADFLRRRVELLADVQQLAKERPWLWELWSAGMIAPAPAAEQHGG
jgi:hypothetical protein